MTIKEKIEKTALPNPVYIRQTPNRRYWCRGIGRVLLEDIFLIAKKTSIKFYKGGRTPTRKWIYEEATEELYRRLAMRRFEEELEKKDLYDIKQQIGVI